MIPAIVCEGAPRDQGLDQGRACREVARREVRWLRERGRGRSRARSDAEVAREALEREADRRSEAPRQPSIRPGEDGLELDSGAAGRRVDVDGTLQALAAWPDEVAGVWETIPTEVSPGDAIAPI